MTYDIESLLWDVEKVLKKHLNSHIFSVEQEKIAVGAPGTGLLPIPDEAYFQQSWADNTLNTSPALIYGVEKIEPTSIGPATEQKVTLFVAIVIVDSGMDKLVKTRIHRYARAAREVFEKHFLLFKAGSIIKIETLLPVSFKFDENTSEEMKIGGVSITTSIA